MSIITNKNIQKVANNSNIRNFTTKLCSPSALLPVVLLEGAVMAGRTYQANERGGKVEARERFIEESATAVVWLWGIQAVNKGFDFIIDNFTNLKKKTGLKDFSFDTGKDSVRKPFEQATKGMDSSSKKLVSALKFSKIVASAAVAVGFSGFVLPKINQKITDNFVRKNPEQLKKAKTTPQSLKMNASNPMRGMKNSGTEKNNKNTKLMDINTFLAKTRGEVGDPQFSSSKQVNKIDNNTSILKIRGEVGDPQKSDSIKFKSGNFFEVAAHQLENDSITQLLTFDTGLFTGRAVNSRNKVERNEILFRDISSSFFYVAATPLIYKGLLMLDSLKGKNTQVSPNIAHDLTNKISERFDNKNNMGIEEFRKEILGKKVVSDSIIKDAKKLFDNSETININKMSEFINKKVHNTTLAENLKKKASKLSEIQPKLNNEKILTVSQVENLFHNGLLNEPEVLNKLINDSTEGKAKNPIKYISQRKVDNHKKHIKNYAKSIIEQAEKEGVKEISKGFLKKMKTRNIISKLGYWGAGMAVSGYFLSTAIPKIQYKITQKTTGKNEFPGIAKYEN